MTLEYELFISNYKNFINSAIANDIKIQSKHNISSNDLIDLSDQNDSEETIHATAIYCKIEMALDFPNVFMAYKGVCTLLPTSATAE